MHSEFGDRLDSIEIAYDQENLNREQFPKNDT